MKPKTRAPRQTKNARLKKRADAALSQLARVELIKPLWDDEPAYFFKHALVQNTAQSTLLHGEYKRLNLLTARAYEKIYAERCIDEYAALLAQHYGEAGDDANTLMYANLAGDQAARVYANVEAISFYTRALDAATRVDAAHAHLAQLFTKRGRVYEVNHQYQDALANYQEMETVGGARKNRSLELTSIILRTTLYATPTPMFDVTLAAQFSDQALALARELDDRAAQAKIFWNLMLVHTVMRDMPAALAYGEKSLTLARELNLREQIALTLNDLARAYVGGGQLARAQTALDEARALWRTMENVPLLADNLMMSATVAMMRGDFDQSLLFSREGLQITHDIDNVVGESANRGTLGGIQIQRGEVAEFLKNYGENVKLNEQTNNHAGLALNNALAAWLLESIGASVAAYEFARRAQERLAYPMPPFFQNWARAFLARYHVLRGDLAAAEMLPSPFSSMQRWLEPAEFVGMLAHGELALAKGEDARVVTLMADFARVLREHGIRASLADVLYLQAQGLRAQGEIERAVEILEQARVEGEALQARLALWRIYAALTEIENGRGNFEQAENFRARARGVVEYIAAHTPEEYRAGFLNLPRVRAVL